MKWGKVLERDENCGQKCVCVSEQLTIFECVCEEKGNSACWYVFMSVRVSVGGVFCWVGCA